MSSFIITALSLSVSGAVIALLLFLSKPLLKNHISGAVMYYVWLVVLVKLVVPIEMPINAMNKLFTQTPVKTVLKTIESPGTAMNPKNIVRETTDTAMTRQPNYEASHNASAVSGVQTMPVEPLAARANFDLWLFMKRNMIWLIGAAAGFIWSVTAYAGFVRKITYGCKNPHTEDLDVFRTLCKNKRIKLKCSGSVFTPMLVGVFRPVIVIPDGEYVSRGVGNELKNILLHELMHDRRKDLVYKWLVVLITSLHWFNPLMPLIRREISRACELSCDEAVIRTMSHNEKQSYGETLLNFGASRRLPIGVQATTLGSKKKALKERLVNIMKFEKLTLKMISLSVAVVLVFVGLSACMGTAKNVPNPLEMISDKLVLYMSPQPNRAMTDAIELFKKQYPDVEVTIKDFHYDSSG